MQTRSREWRLDMPGRPEWGQRLLLNRVCVGPEQRHGPEVVPEAANGRHCSRTRVRPSASSQPTRPARSGPFAKRQSGPRRASAPRTGCPSELPALSPCSVPAAASSPASPPVSESCHVDIFLPAPQLAALAQRPGTAGPRRTRPFIPRRGVLGDAGGAGSAPRPGNSGTSEPARARPGVRGGRATLQTDPA